ncbi:cytochrome c class I [Leptothrix cholodnii SP-6]|uniref:Cytochrome c class I n=1 Tax=Leptothrix cholodnii (strain ATCC 51168 / LMG 8142 / SP-6) TaxID=395495 RepID=B1XXA2_LEPCP|nr:c-type cytochrome [Leptothrix cholodnii]ACB33883.1 cytochrome c class I [Leptothrix cholodnii SP-6]
MKKTHYVLMALAMTAGLSSVQAQEAKPGDAAAGQTKAAMCIGCHGIPGYRASFPEVYQVPMISGQGGKYIAAALAAYKKGDRKHPTMRSIAGSLTEQDVADLAAFYESQGAGAASAATVQPSGQVAELLTKGNCAACHGDNLNKPIDGSYPKLAGQPADYLFAALKAYKVDGTSHVVGRANAIMGAQVKPYSNAELKVLAKHIASLPSDLKVVPNPKFR